MILNNPGECEEDAIHGKQESGVNRAFEREQAVDQDKKTCQSQEIRNGGVDGLIASIATKNKSLEANQKK